MVEALEALRQEYAELVGLMTNEEAISKIIEAAEHFGWNVSFPNNDEDLIGMIIGTEEYIEKVLSGDYADS